jgi:hypothetical protein
MLQADYRGARGSNAGDDFHELWALRQALALLDESTGLTTVTVEGLTAEDESGTPPDTWDGVDCTLYYGGDHAASAERIVVAQLKYSAANPDQPWTLARLTKSSNKKKDNSVIGRLAKAFAGLKSKRSDLVATGNVVVRLVSNQPVDPAVSYALSGQSALDQKPKNKSQLQPARAVLLTASGLPDEDFEAFTRVLDLSECGQGSRFALEECVLATIADWTDDDARAAVNDLMRFMRRAMMPEAKGELITRQSVLLWLGFSDPGALFPCPSPLKKVERLVPREASRIVAERMLSGNQRICLHGEAGCGKTTALQEIEALLPRDSVVIIFDCYGGGRYLDSDAYRHRPRDAFLQLSNDLARRLRTPLLVSRSGDRDHPRVFKRRLEKAAEVVASQSDDALLVIAVDAADNSVTAASTRSPQERSFVHDFVSVGDLPKNVRFVITGCTGRLPEINLPQSFTRCAIKGFNRDETATHVRGVWNDAPDAWIDDFHHLSDGNPRVQQYALDYAGPEPARALDYLHPNGKGLDQIFRDQFKYALNKQGRTQDINVFAAGLIALPRPVPLSDLSAVTGLSDAHICDLCADLAPGVRLMNGSIGFADEDFEHFVGAEAEAQLGTIQARVAERFVSRHRSDEYAATHVAAALLTAGRGREIIDLIKSEPKIIAIVDPVLRREAQLQRLRIAMKVCREAGDISDTMLTLLIGAEALKTGAAIQRMLIENPDLAANFARDTSSRAVLRDPNEIENHGPLLFHLMAAEARDGDAISVREGYRQVLAWLQRRDQNFKEQRSEHPNSEPQGWSVNGRDIAAEIEGMLRIAGPRSAVESVLRWRPRSVALRVASILSLKLIIAGESALVERCITEARIPTAWNLFLLTPLALAGKEVELSRLESSLACLLRRRLIRLDKLRETWRDENPTAEYLDMIITACEVIVAHGRDPTCIVPVLERIADRESRRRDRLFTSDIPLIDLTLRAHALLERLAGRKPTIDTYWTDPPEPSEELPPKQIEQLKRADGKKKEELQAFIGPLIDIYDIRAQALIGSIPPGEVDTQLQPAIAHYHNEEYRLSRNFWAREMRTRAAVSITQLIALRGLDRTALLERASSLLSARSDPFDSAETQIFARLALERSLHQQILSVITDRARVVRSMRASAEDKIAALIRFARLLLPISYGDAESLFNEAIEVAGEVNAEAIHEIALFAPLAERAVGSMSVRERRAVARNLAVIIGDAGVRLAGYEHFPWVEAAQALTTLDVCLALAAAARWEDSSIVHRSTFVPSILKTALSRHELSPAQVSALLPLVDQLDGELLIGIIEEASRQKSGPDLKSLAEEVAREELLRFGRGTRQEVSEKLSSLLTKSSPGFWLDRLVRATAFHQIERPGRVSPPGEAHWSHRREESEVEQPDPLDSIDWTAHRFVSANEVDDVIGRATAAARASNTFVLASTILDRIRSIVALGDRAAHLDALISSDYQNARDYELAQAIAKGVEAWHDAPSIRHWCRERLMQVVANLLPRFCRWLAHGDSPLPSLLEKSGVPAHQICAALLEGMERHVDALSAPTVYALVGLVGRYCTPGEAAQVIARYADRLLQRIPAHERDDWDLTDIPMEAAGSIARFLYALMGDVDVRIRWRAAHALRRIARLGDLGTLDKLIELYGRTSEPSYRKPEAPFYWLAARLWLVIALDRIAVETPSAVGHHGQWLLEIASNVEFPHVLIRSFAKSAVCRLVENGDLALNLAQRNMLKRANTSPVRRRKGRDPYSVSFGRYKYREYEQRRFYFDTMDTLPYWYSGALRRFADLNGEEFLDAAERWIVDRWDVQSNPWRWDDEPRHHRFSDRSLLSMHSHGSLPTMERFRTHLEWHAMWCATGELMQTRALAKVGDDDYDTFEHWLSREGLTAPPLWLADLRGMKPLEDRLWFAPQENVDAWVEDVDDDDFLAELGLISEDGTIVVGGNHDTRSRNFMLSAKVQTAPVSPDTASALMRALQTVDSSWDYRIPPAGDDLEIDVPPYTLVGWLLDTNHELGIDERDPLRYEVRAIECRPSHKTATALNLEFVHTDQARWIEASRRHTVFVYEAWGDNRGDEGDDRFAYDETVRSSGWRLRADKDALRIFLNEMGLDMIVEIEITRRNKGYDYSRYGEEGTKESRFDRVLLLRRDGSIEAADGRLGTWTSPRA